MDFLAQTVAGFDRLIAPAQSARAILAAYGDRRYFFARPATCEAEWRNASRSPAWPAAAKAAQAATDRILALHSYAVPEVTVMPIIAGLPAYLEWAAVSVDRKG